MAHKSEGVCRFCLKTFAGSVMTRHLLTCKVKKDRDSQETANASHATDGSCTLNYTGRYNMTAWINHDNAYDGDWGTGNTPQQAPVKSKSD